jgi:hypothetical protein
MDFKLFNYTNLITANESTKIKFVQIDLLILNKQSFLCLDTIKEWLII